LRVLNAFRHQRKNHAASKADVSPVANCAQRLSASTKEPLPESPGTGTAGDVLNAFRHQRKNHFNGIYVANFLVGAQRLSASTKEPRRALIVWPTSGACSTPFGINERTTPVFRNWFHRKLCAQRLSASTKEPQYISFQDFFGTKVLNAFRHQRKNHLQRIADWHYLLKCSTPFGINERTTVRDPLASSSR